MLINRMAVLIHSFFWEKELREHLRSRCDYQKLQTLLGGDTQTAEEQKVGLNTPFNNDAHEAELTRAIYFTSETIYRGNGLEKRTSPGHNGFLGALRGMGYEVVNAYNSIDAYYCLNALQIAQSGTVDTIVMLGLTIDHVPTMWAIRGAGVRLVSLLADSRDTSERIKTALNTYHNIRDDESFLMDLPSRDDQDSTSNRDAVSLTEVSEHE